MKTVYFVRHGESQANVDIPVARGVFQGEKSPLTEKGREQARFIADRCTRLPMDVILSSPATRAHETALEIQRATGRSLELHDFFSERRPPSILLGHPRSDPVMRDMLMRWQSTLYKKGSRVGDGENFEDLKARIVFALKYLADRPESHIVVATHGFFLHILVSVVLLGKELSIMEFSKMARRVMIGNTGLTQLELMTREDAKLLDGVPYEGWILRVWNDHAHLG